MLTYLLITVTSVAIFLAMRKLFSWLSKHPHMSQTPSERASSRSPRLVAKQADEDPEEALKAEAHQRELEKTLAYLSASTLSQNADNPLKQDQTSPVQDLQEHQPTPEALLNRIGRLKHMPKIALALCKRLPDEDALELRIEIGTDLFLQEREEEALALLEELSPEAQASVLEQTLTYWSASGQYEQALRLIEKRGIPLPEHPLYHALLQAHQGNQYEARHELDLLVEQFSAQEPEQRQPAAAVKIAELALQLGQSHTANRLLQLIWDEIESTIAEHIYLLEWLIPLLLTLGERNKIKALAAKLSTQEIAELILGDVYKKDAFLGDQLLRTYCTYQNIDDQDYVLTALLDSNQLQQAQALLRTIKADKILMPALRYALFLAANDNWQTISPEIESLVPSVTDQLTIYSEISFRYLHTQPAGLLELLDHIEALTRRQPANHPERAQLLQRILVDQIARKDEPALAIRAQRLEEIYPLIENITSNEERFNSFIELAKTLIAAGATEEALANLNKAESTLLLLPQPDEDDPYASMAELDQLALNYLQAGEKEKALTLKEQVEGGDFTCLAQWAIQLSQLGHFEKAISVLRNELLGFADKPLEAVYKTFISSPQGLEYKDQLLDTITSNPFWDPWSYGVMKPLILKGNSI